MSLIRLPDPDRNIMARRDKITAELVAIAGREAVISDEDGRRAFDTDALTSYRRMPLAVVLPERCISSTVQLWSLVIRGQARRAL